MARLFSGWTGRRDAELAIPPARQAHDFVWDREIGRLGRAEVVRRIAAVSDFRSGRSGPSGFEAWNHQIERDILRLTYEIADREDRNS